MATLALAQEPFIAEIHIANRTATALRSLMQMWEQDVTVEEEESESELMVMLSGMVGSHATALDD